MVGTKITRQKMENQMLGTKITCPRVGQYKNNSPKGWTDGELNERIENNSSYCLTPDGELNEQLKK